MTKYIVTGGAPLRGKVQLHGAKNAGFKEMIAALLADSPSTICNLGLISEIDFASSIIKKLGGRVTFLADPHCLRIDPQGLSKFAIPPEMSHRSRFSMMYAGPLLAKFGQAIFPKPGGDKFAKRPIDRHIDGLKALGASIAFAGDNYQVSAPNGLKGTTFHFSKNTHNGTEVLLLASVKARGTTVLENAAAEPEINDLIVFLNDMGAKIKRTEERTIKIEGVKKLHGVKHDVMKDRNEAVTFGCMALGTRGSIFIQGANPKVLGAFLKAVNEAGGKYDVKPGGITISWQKDLKSTSITAAPYPAFMTDWQPLWATLMTQANGTSIIHETIYENRFDYVPGLVKMGAKIDYFQPKVNNPDKFYNFNIGDDSPTNFHAIKVHGPTILSGTRLEINDIRSGATAMLAGMVAKGKTTIIDPKDQIKRGYEDLPGRLRQLGATIQQKDLTSV